MPQVIAKSVGFGLVGDPSGSSGVWLMDRSGDFRFDGFRGSAVDELLMIAPGIGPGRAFSGRDGEICRSWRSRVFCDRTQDGGWGGNRGGDLATFVSIAAGEGIFLYADVDGDGVRQLVKYLPAFGPGDEFHVDLNQNDVWDGVAGGDLRFPLAPEIGPGTPFACDCDGDGTDELGKVLSDGSTLVIDRNASLTWDGAAGGDAVLAFGVLAGPGSFLFTNLDGVPGDEIVKYHPSLGGRDWFQVDLTGNLQWDGVAGGDAWMLVSSGAGPGDPCAIDPDGDGTSVLCKWWRQSFIFVDLNGNGVWEGTVGGDVASRFRYGAEGGVLLVLARPE